MTTSNACFLTNLTISSSHPVTKVGALYSGKRDFDLQLTKTPDATVKSGFTTFDPKTPGFYFILINGCVQHVSHAGIQKRQLGFREVLNRLNCPRTFQNSNFSRSLSKSMETWVVQVVHMSYAAVRAVLEIDEYSAQNNGLHMLSLLREKYTIVGRKQS